MSCKLLIGNIDTETSEEGIRQIFMPIMSQVISIDIPQDVRTGKNRGYAFVKLRTDLQGENAVRELHGTLAAGRNITITIVEEAPPKGKWYKFGAV